MLNSGRSSQSERGQVIILLAAGLITLLAFVSLAIDGGMYLSDRRDAQGSADAAALSAARAACLGEDPAAAAVFAASLGGYSNTGDKSVTVYAPPMNGEYAGVSGYYEVVISTVTEGAFLKLFISEGLVNTVRAVTTCEDNSTNPAIIGSALVSLNPDAPAAFLANGNPNVTVTSGGIFVNSDNPVAMDVHGNNAEVTADSIAIVGGAYLKNPDNVNPIPTTGVKQITNPFDELSPPPKPAGPCTTVSLSSSSNVTIDPGLYCSISVAGNAALTMNSGVYWIETGDVRTTGGGSIYANEVLIYMGPNAGGFDVTGTGDFAITPPTSGDFAGMAFFQDPANSNTFKIAGNGDNTSMAGSFLAPAALNKIVGNGDLNVSAQMIGDKIQCSGNGDITITHDPDGNYHVSLPITISLME